MSRTAKSIGERSSPVGATIMTWRVDIDKRKERNSMHATRLSLIFGVLIAVGCGDKEAGRKAGDTERPGGMAGMPMDSGGGMGDHMGMESMEMMPMMRAHMDSMMRMSPAQMSQMMAKHESTMSQMMDRMGADMRGMNMGGGAEWNALSDSVRRDLADLPGLQGNELAARMKAHAERVGRLLAMHETMMKNM